jgi:hypothetical protein
MALAGSRRIDEIAARLLVAGESDRAKELEVYLHGSEAQLVGAYRERSGRNL